MPPPSQPSPSSPRSSFGNDSTDAQYGVSPPLAEAWQDGDASHPLGWAGSPSAKVVQDDSSRSQNISPSAETTMPFVLYAGTQELSGYKRAEGILFESDSSDSVTASTKRRKRDHQGTWLKATQRETSQIPASPDAGPPDGESDRSPAEGNKIEERENETTGKQEGQGADVDEASK
ncbi:uncharacterized protein GIQ15_04725 [Arthroderma uncinatum]|uniref:uncharacterized protein n=1 Tax=Arthroderma uncinatum TaxID=74035 RepID=UPI00144A78BA|nr:uncharacterized protein GIQ15_04725 [Arthroderma uncinatum]KAF3481966.1 hypothetical protein GIQ15_04725 [Arthroderma uncinatum]